jgi:hypothetical protein
VYEKHGLMVKITNPKVLAYLRKHEDQTNVSLIEQAFCDMLNIPEVYREPKPKGRKKATADNANAMPVKISNQFLIDYICNQKKTFGICQRHTVETALLRYMEKHA